MNQINPNKPQTVFQERDNLWRENQRLKEVVARHIEIGAATQRIVDAAVAVAIVDSAERKVGRIGPRFQDDPEGYEITKRAWQILAGAVDEADYALDAAVTAYRALTEPSDIMNRPAVRRATEIVAAAEDGRLAGVVEQIQELANTSL
jgi:hypothetical protein